MSNLIKNILTSTLLFLVAIGGFFVSYDTGILKTNNLYALGEFNAGADSQAANTTSSPTASQEQSKWLNEAIQTVNAILGVLTIMVSPAIILAGWLLSPDWTSGDLFGLRVPMHDIWVIISNIVYFIYAILLIIIALATIFGKDNFSYKTMLPKLAVGILMVPFTWWFVQWTISLSTVVTASVINIPMDMIKKDNKYINGNFIPKEHYITTNEDDKTDNNKEKINCNIEPKGGNPEYCTNIHDILEKGGGTYSTLMIYAYQVFRIQDIKKIDTTKDTIISLGQLLNQVVIGAIMFLIFGILVIALISVLMMRAIKLWFYAIFSPLFTLHFVAGKELFGKSTDGFDIKEFIGLCFVPAIIGLTLSFGLMIVSVIQSPTTNIAEPCKSINLTSIPPKAGEGCTLVRIFGNENNKIVRGIYEETKDKRWMYNIVSIGGMTIYFKGKATVSNDVAAADAGSVTGALDSAGGIFGTLIIDIIAIIFIWMAFMGAKGVNKGVEKILAPFSDMGEKIGKMAMDMPKYTPLPIPGGSLAGANKAITQLGNIPEQMADKRYKESDLGKFIQNIDPSQKLSDELNALTVAIKGENSPMIIAKKSQEMANKATGEQMLNNMQIDGALGKFTTSMKGRDAEVIGTFGPLVGKKINEVINNDKIDEKEKKILVGALMKGYDPTNMNISDIKSSVSKAKTHLSSAGTGSSSAAGTGGAAGNTVTASKTTGDNIVINIHGQNIDAKMDGKIGNTDNLKRIADKSLGKKDEFEKKIADGLEGTVGVDQSKKMAKELIDKIPKEKFAD